jgi:hypothetical protein
MHLQSSLSSAETMQAKELFEQKANTYGVKIQHYHADNGRFADNLFMELIRRERQSITFCGVNAHFQNGVAEKRIRDLQDMTHTDKVLGIL